MSKPTHAVAAARAAVRAIGRTAMAMLAVFYLRVVKIIEMNRQQVEDQCGDAKKAESWSCVVIAREGLWGAKSC